MTEKDALVWTLGALGLVLGNDYGDPSTVHIVCDEDCSEDDLPKDIIFKFDLHGNFQEVEVVTKK